ncbi:16S rRNA (guanine(966)-N(2))-methyltransferase RsmD [Candidatus Enterovibrio altilux]|uniref:Ribosomal RNA small subunit methyltransferase D n=1 Tax=Candidatus Enterovibrio altilux TaxID=1927128 RepID=A0A291B929_9GAMM|nr:16S rRNA (guanine(966)-N(2))-methyltransferase RsmD [Candidatus Enterovibrio luxaltus]ATF09504.1 16S rRNA (guanine(966)-N(2))-methyltransferase [Candidatus Enterovibrio luxaltus]
MVIRNPKNFATRNTRTCKNSSLSVGNGSGFIRIISGKWRGRKLPVKNIEGLRPTTNRIKETVFNWLATNLYQAKCLDVFAGSGGLGLEALSRNAEHVTLLELNTEAAEQIKLNINTLKADNAMVLNTDALTYLSQPGQAFNVTFIDPPFRKKLLNDAISQLEQNGWLSQNALIYVEAEKELSNINVPMHWEMLQEKYAGQVNFRLYQRKEK